jgi:hypothetical protein
LTTSKEKKVKKKDACNLYPLQAMPVMILLPTLLPTMIPVSKILPNVNKNQEEENRKQANVKGGRGKRNNGLVANEGSEMYEGGGTVVEAGRQTHIGHLVHTTHTQYKFNPFIYKFQVPVVCVYTHMVTCMYVKSMTRLSIGINMAVPESAILS